MSPALLDHLRFIYGPESAARIAPDLDALVRRHRPETLPARPAARRTLTQRDALLITYADQVRTPDEPPLRTLRDFARRHLRSVVSGIHVLPFYPWSSDDGFAVRDYLAVEPAYGTWDDVRLLGEDFDLMFDLVLNHASSAGAWFRSFLDQSPPFDRFFVTVDGDPDLSGVVRPRAQPLLRTFETSAGPRKVWTTFGPDQADLDYRNPEVLLAMLDILLTYVGRGASFLRLDAVAFLWKEIGTSCLHLPRTHRVIQLFRTVLDEVAPEVLIVTETNVPHADNLSYFGDGFGEAQLVYNFALPPLVLHAVRNGHARTLADWIRSLSLPSRHVTFFNFLASHDGIGLNPARGLLPESEIERLVAEVVAQGGFVSYKHLPDGSRSPYELNVNYLDALADKAGATDDAVRRLRLAHAIQCSLPGIPGLYFHSLFGSRGDRAAAEASGIPRRINRARTDRDRLEAELADPSSLRSRAFGALRELLEFRAARPAFAPSSPHRVLELDPRVLGIVRGEPGHSPVLCLHNLAAEPVTIDRPADCRPAERAPSPPIADPGIDSGRTLTLPAHGVVWVDLA